MNVTIDLQAKINDYLAERRSMGFKLDNMGAALANFARFAANRSHQGPLTTTLMADTTEAIFGLPPMSQWDENASVFSVCGRITRITLRIPAIVGSDSADRGHPRKAYILVTVILCSGGHDGSSFGVP